MWKILEWNILTADSQCYFYLKNYNYWTSLVAQWLRICVSTARGAGSIPGWETKILHATLCGKKQTKSPTTIVNTVF